jgi:hypothetical protein
MLKFNRLAALATDIDDIAAALRDSHLIDLSEDSQRIRRNPDVPLPENTLEYWQEIKRRTVYMVCDVQRDVFSEGGPSKGDVPSEGCPKEIFLPKGTSLPKNVAS